MKKIRISLLSLLILPLFSLAQTAPVIGLNVGNIAPEILLKNPNDSLIPLSSLRGKMVLIDFWASWCGPCRFENPNVVKTYNTYKDSSFANATSFTVYSVSLDRQGGKAQWEAAIKKDGLVWPYHVSDLMFWQSAAAKTFQINSIPTNFLIDGNGIIVAKELRGEKLGQTIGKLVVTKPKDTGKPKKKKKEKKEKKEKKATGTTDMLNERRRILVQTSC